MNDLILSIFYLVFIYLVNNIFLNNNFLPNYTGQIHQKYSGFKKIPLSGGFFFTFFVTIIFFKFSPLLSLFIFFIFLTGIISDLDLVKSPKFRFLIQFLLITTFVIIFEIKIFPTRFILLDILLSNIYVSFAFSIFCLLVLINGSNFIDGLNGLLLGYFILILLIIFYLSNFANLDILINKKHILNLAIILFILLVFNFRNKLFMGDSGAYSLSFVLGYLLIKTYEMNQFISPYFIVLLLWYPCFENLFSIIRKFTFRRSPLNPDNNHFHQLLFHFLKKKLILKKININNLTSVSILLYNFSIFSLSLIDIKNSQLQILLIFINIFVYLRIYYGLFFYKNNKYLGKKD